MTNPLEIGLPKWPALLVMGKKVTPDQAIEINFRTASRWWSTNDRQFLEFVADTIGASVGDYGFMDFSTELAQKWGIVDLSYLANSNIMSSYIGGPHGWCSWEGAVFANSYNIGKWPSVEEVKEEWENIARAFPFLSLRSQLMSGEQCEEDTKALVEFVVEDGKVDVLIPDPEPMIPVANEGVETFLRAMDSRYREHGTEQQFTERYNRFKVIRGL